MLIPEAKVQEIIFKSRILDVVSDYVNLNLKGDRYWGLSPFKPEKTPSFTVSPDKGVYYCFSTQEGGNVVNFLMKMENLTFPEALKKLAERFGIEIDKFDEKEDAQHKEKLALSELYQRLSQSFHHLLTATKEGEFALNYLKSRAISDELIKKFEVGYAPRDPDWLYAFLQKKGYSEALLQKSGLFSKRSVRWPLFNHRLMFPIRNPSGQVMAFGGRLLEGDGPKYINSPETPLYHKGSNLYGLFEAKDSIRKESNGVLCEGYMDVIALHQGGITNACAPLGTAFTEEQAKILKRSCQELILLFDNDSAGIAATLKSLGIAERNEFATYIISLPDAKDPADILLRDGPDGLLKILNYKVNAFDYLLRKASSEVNILSPSGKDHVIKEFTAFIKNIPNEIKRNESMALLASRLSVESKKLQSEFKRRGVESEKRVEEIGKQPVRQARKMNSMDPRSQFEIKLMAAVFIHADYFAYVRQETSLESFRSEWARDLYLALEEAFRKDEKEFEYRLSKLEFEELRSYIRKKMVENEYTVETERFIQDGLRRLQILVLEARRSEIELEIVRVNSKAEYELAHLQNIIEEKMIIDTTLRDLQKHD